jgi:chromosome segregation ATPase
MTIEWAMWFALGFLSAGIVALLLMGAVWRRAVRLTTRRISASVPTGVADVLAETDMMRARHARDRRTMELAVADMRRQNADARLSVGRARQELDEVRVQYLGERDARVAGEAREAEQAATIAARDARITELSSALEGALERGRVLDQAAAAREAEIARTAAAHAEATAKAAEELAFRRADVVGLEETLRKTRLELAETRAKLEAEETAHRLSLAAVGQERDRADRLDKRINRLVEDVADREERIDRVGRELERARQALVLANARAAALGGSGDGTAAAGDNLLRSLTQLENRNHELEEKLANLGADASKEAKADLRASLSDLAARIVHLTRLAEGASSSIDRISAGSGETGGEGGQPSLAQRIRELQRIADEREAAKSRG